MAINKTVSFHTLGCRLNFSETGSIVQGFTERGYQVVPFGEKSDVVMINTCTVTDAADSTCRNLIRKAQKSSPEAQIAVVGCYSQMEPEAIAAMQGVDIVLGTAEKYKIFDYLDLEQGQIINVDMTNDFWGAQTAMSDGHTRAFLKIQDGCNYICSFCIIPQARGRSRAIPMNEALSQAHDLVSRGFKEIILTGVNIGEYEKASGTPLYRLIDELGKVKGLERLRLSSVEPNTMSDDLIRALKNCPNIMDHFHIPLQSGCDDVLKKMRRKYDTSFYKDVIYKLKDQFPQAAIGADVICGHPGETEEQFIETYELLKELPITHFHVFPYSKRKGTTAAKELNHIPYAVKKKRVATLNSFGEMKLRQFSEKMIGQKNNVLFEKRNKEGLFEGYTTNFVRVAVESDADLSNQIRSVYLDQMNQGKLRGKVIL
jgi:threonylcarbamoyladenosine tRNA methylthiotransferase MtaB